MKNKLIKTQIIIMIFIILGKAVGFLREIILASKFGTTYEMDTYSFSITLLLFLATIGYAITTTVIPIFIELKEKRNFKEQEQVANNLISIVVILGIIITVISAVLSKFIVVIFAPGFTGESFEIARKLIMIMNCSIISILVQSVITGVLQANNKFYAPASMAFIGNIITVIYLLFFIDSFGIIGFGCVTVIAYFAQLLVNIPSYKKLGYRYYFYIDLKNENVKEVFKLILPILASTCIMQLATFVNNFYGSLIAEGAISIYNYSNRIISLGMEIFPIAISMVIYPLLSKMGSNGENEEFNRVFGDGVVLMSLVIVPIGILMLMLRVDIVRVLYERNSFTEQSTMMTSQMLLVLIPTMVAGGMRDLINKACYSLKEVKIPMISSVLTIIITILINFLLYKNIGITSLGISTSIATVLGTLITFVYLRKKYKFIKLSINYSLIKVLIAGLLMGVAVYLIKNFLNMRLDDGMLSSIIYIIISGVVGCCVYMLLLVILRVKELRLISKKKK